MKYRSQISITYIFACAFMIVFSCYMVGTTMSRFNVFNLLLSIVLVAFTAMICIRPFRTYYIIGKHEVIIHNIFKVDTIPYKKIKKVEVEDVNSSILSLIKQQVLIHYGKQTASASPRDMDGFLSELKKRAEKKQK